MQITLQHGDHGEDAEVRLRIVEIGGTAPKLIKLFLGLALHQFGPLGQRAHASRNIEVRGVRQHRRADQIQITEGNCAEIVER